MEKPGYAPNYNADHRSPKGEIDSARPAYPAEELAAECLRLREKVERLRRVLVDNDIDPDPSPRPTELPVPRQPALPRIQLNTEKLSRGRNDGYAARSESPDGRHGYSQAHRRRTGGSG